MQTNINKIIRAYVVTVHRCLQDKAPRCLVDCGTLVSEVTCHGLLCSASPHHLTVPRIK